MINNNYSHKAFTLVEIMMWVLIFSLIIIWGFKAYSWVLIWKIKLIESTDIQKEAFYFSEKFFEEIKKWWTIDYEEYFNRKVVWTSTQSGHYDIPTWFWNYGKLWNIWTTTYGDGFYYCRSWNASKMWSWGCVTNDTWNTVDWQNSQPQRFWQYTLQFIDYNSNFDDDKIQPANIVTLLGDEDWDWNIIWDDDDEYLGEWPKAFSGSEVKEIYLISADGKNRTMFRWNINDDTDNPTNNCDYDTWSWGCRGTIEFLKLEWKDFWRDHDATSAWSTKYDGVVDTWVISKDFDPAYPDISATKTLQYSIAAWKTNAGNIVEYRQPLFWNNINVTDVKFFAYPNKDLKLAWKDAAPEVNIAPYIRIQMTLKPSYKARRWIKWKIPEIKINTTISLTDIYSR